MTEPAVLEPPDAPDETRQDGPVLEWRRKKAEQSRGTLERREFPVAERMELREDADTGLLKLTGYASVTGNPYEVGFFTETIKRGAFKRTLAEKPDVQLLINHGAGGSGMPIARTKSGTMRLSEDERGLKVEADLDPEDPDVQLLARKMRRGDIDQMSFAFQATDETWNSDYTDREITAASIHRGDVSVVNQAANPAAMASIRSTETLAALRRAGGEGLIAALEEWSDRRHLPSQERAGKALSGKSMDVLSKVLELVATADDAVDQAQPLLATLMGVPNPDDAPSSKDSKPAPVDARAYQMKRQRQLQAAGVKR